MDVAEADAAIGAAVIEAAAAFGAIVVVEAAASGAVIEAGSWRPLLLEQQSLKVDDLPKYATNIVFFSRSG